VVGRGYGGGQSPTPIEAPPGEHPKDRQELDRRQKKGCFGLEGKKENHYKKERTKRALTDSGVQMKKGDRGREKEKILITSRSKQKKAAGENQKKKTIATGVEEDTKDRKKKSEASKKGITTILILHNG